MDRRNLLALAALLPVLATAPASACSVALKSPRFAGLQNEQIRTLFDAWWQRDKARFQDVFTKTLMSNGSPMDAELAAELMVQSPIANSTFDIFDHFFTDDRKTNRLTLVVNSDAGVVVACSEQDQLSDMEPDCSGMPLLHLFLVSLSGLNARAITHLGSGPIDVSVAI